MAKAQAQEPSMEEILASIRKIIADEETAPKGAAAKAPAAEETISEDDLDKLFSSAGDDEEGEDEDDDVLELTEEISSDDPPLVEGFGEATDVAFEDIAEESEPEFEPEPEPPPPPPPPPAPKPAPVVAKVAPPPPPPPAPPPIAREPVRLEPADVADAVAPLISHATEGAVSSAFSDLALTVLNRNARTLEDLVQEMLRPMLKGWLDQNLPGMVERLVRAEIERVTRSR